MAPRIRGAYSSTAPPGLTPQEAATTHLAAASSMRTAISFEPNPPKTTEWTAPSLSEAVWGEGWSHAVL